MTEAQQAKTLVAESKEHGRIARAKWTPGLHSALIDLADDHTDTNDGFDYWGCEPGANDRMAWRVELSKHSATLRGAE